MESVGSFNYSKQESKRYTIVSGIQNEASKLISNISKTINQSEVESISSNKFNDLNTHSKKSIADKMQIEFSKESEHLAELRKRNSKVISFTCVTSENEYSECSNADNNQMQKYPRHILNLKDMCVKEDSDESQISISIPNGELIVQQRESTNSKSKINDIENKASSPPIDCSSSSQTKNEPKEPIAKRFSYLLDRLRVRQYEEEKDEKEGVNTHKKIFDTHNRNFQNYNDSFISGYLNNKKSPIGKLQSRLKEIGTVKRNRNLKEFEIEIKNKQERDLKILSKL